MSAFEGDVRMRILGGNTGKRFPVIEWDDPMGLVIMPDKAHANLASFLQFMRWLINPEPGEPVLLRQSLLTNLQVCTECGKTKGVELTDPKNGGCLLHICECMVGRYAITMTSPDLSVPVTATLNIIRSDPDEKQRSE